MKIHKNHQDYGLHGYFSIIGILDLGSSYPLKSEKGAEIKR